MRIGRSYKQHPITGSYDVIVIGSGIGGLGTAALLARHRGKRVLVLERHYTAGGFTHVFHRKNYEWDVGIHYIGEVTEPETAVGALMNDVTDGALQWADMGEVYDTIYIGGDRFAYHKGVEAFRQAMHGFFPREREAIDRYIALVWKATYAGRRFFMHKSLPDPLPFFTSPILRWPCLRLSRRTTLEVLQSLTRDPVLIATLTALYPDYGAPPSRSSFLMHALVVQHYWNGAAYPVGGSSRIAECILPVIERAGGAVHTSAEVEQILVENGRAVGVRLAGGEEVRAPCVVSDAGADTTFGRLLSPAEAARAGARPIAGHPSLAHLALYLGFARGAADLGLTKSNLWIHPGPDLDGTLARHFADPERTPLPLAYVSFPGAKDPSFEARHPGRTTIEVLTITPYQRFACWQDTRWRRRDSDYDALKERLQAELLESLFTHCPQLRGQVDHAELSTPLTTRHFANYQHGEIYGLDHTPARFGAAWLRPKTGIRGLYLTGADVCTAGLAGAIRGAMMTASAITSSYILRDVERAAAARALPPASVAISNTASKGVANADGGGAADIAG